METTSVERVAEPDEVLPVHVGDEHELLAEVVVVELAVRILLELVEARDEHGCVGDHRRRLGRGFGGRLRHGRSGGLRLGWRRLRGVRLVRGDVRWRWRVGDRSGRFGRRPTRPWRV